MYSYLRVPICTLQYLYMYLRVLCVGVWELYAGNCSAAKTPLTMSMRNVHTSLIMTQQKQQNKKPAKWNLCRLFVYTGRIVLCTMAVK